MAIADDARLSDVIADLYGAIDLVAVGITEGLTDLPEIDRLLRDAVRLLEQEN